jgi:tetratricopeptide (TPR) repeat protein
MEIINKAIDLNPEFSESFILKYGINFNRFIYESDKMMEIAMTSSTMESQIEKMDPDNPRFNYMKGMHMFYTPEAFGGGVKSSVEHFEKAYKLFENRIEKEEYYPSWGYDLTCGYLAMCYKKLGDAEKSKMYYDKGLEINPESGFLMSYVKNELEK